MKIVSTDFYADGPHVTLYSAIAYHEAWRIAKHYRASRTLKSALRFKMRFYARLSVAYVRLRKAREALPV